VRIVLLLQALMSKIQTLADDAEATQVQFDTTHNAFMLLSNTQFMEHVCICVRCCCSHS